MAEARLRFGAMGAHARPVLPARPRDRLEATTAAGSTRGPRAVEPPAGHRPARPRRRHRARRRRRPPRGALGRGLLRRADVPGGPPPVAHMRPDAAAFMVPHPVAPRSPGARVLLLDDTYVSGARSQSAGRGAGAVRSPLHVIAPIGRVLRPSRIALHAEIPAPARGLKPSLRPGRPPSSARRSAPRTPPRGLPPPGGPGAGATGAPPWVGRRGRTGGPGRCTDPGRPRTRSRRTAQEGRHRLSIARAWTRPTFRACAARGCCRGPRRSRPDCSASSPGGPPAPASAAPPRAGDG